MTQRRRLTKEIIIENVNRWGSLYPQNIRFRFVKQISTGNCFKVIVQNCMDKSEKVVVYKDLKRYNPFRVLKQTDEEVKTRVNKLGLKSEDKYFYCNHFRKNGRLYVSIKHKVTKEIKILTIKELTRITNPYTRKINNYEKGEFHPIIEDRLKKEGFLFEQEYFFKNGHKKLYADFKVYNKYGDFIIIEAKHDRTSHGRNIENTYNQVEQYHKVLSGKDKYKGIIAISSHGEVCYSLDDAIVFLNRHLKNKI